MARLTVEDCLEKIDNRFDLILLAAKRARQLSQGMEPKVEIDRDKPTVLALREIAAGLVTEDNINPPTAAEEFLDGLMENGDDSDASETAVEATATEETKAKATAESETASADNTASSGDAEDKPEA